MILKRLPARIDSITELSPTAREVHLTLPEPLGFLPGSFVNVFLGEGSERIRRAYSISSSDAVQNAITLSIRKGAPGGMSERFWEPNIRNTPLQIMGPLGLNTADRITNPRVFLFGFGIGVSVVKGLVEELLGRHDTTEVTVMTGSRTEEEVLYKEFFESLERSDSRLRTRFVVSRPNDQTYLWKGHIHDHIDDLDFSHATVYLCGKKSACESLQERIAAKTKTPVEFLVEAFD